MDNYSKDILSEIQERAFSEGYNQALIEKMYAEEGAKEKEAILDRLKRYGGKVKDLAWGDKWEGNKLRRGVTIGTAAGLGTLAYLKHKKAKAEAAAEALEEAAEAQREYSAILAERIYSEEEEGKKSGYGKAAALGALGAGAGLGAGVLASNRSIKSHVAGNQAVSDKLKKALESARIAADSGAGAGFNPEKIAALQNAEKEYKKLDQILAERNKKFDDKALSKIRSAVQDNWYRGGKTGKAKVIGGAALALGAGAGLGAGVKKLKDKRSED